MRLTSIVFISLLAIGFLTGCSGAQSMAKRGDKMLEAGHYEQAADFYYNALSRNRNNIRARMGMVETGQRVLNNKLDKFSRANKMGELHEAVALFREAERYENQIDRVGVDLEIPTHYKQDYKASKEIVLEELYDEAMQLMEEERFEQAEAKFKEVKTLDPNYRDARELSAVAYSEPLYIQGEVALENGAYRMAYDYFQQILDRAGDYKDTRALQEEALENGRITVALVPFENVTREANIEKKVSAYLLDDLSKIPDPFLRFVDRSDMDKILEEQQLSVSGIIDEETAGEVGELVGAQAIITGKVLDFKSVASRPRSEVRKGYEGYQVKRRSPENGVIYYETRYKPVTYREYSAGASVNISFQFKLLSLNTGEVMVSRIVNREAQDAVNYATYDGNATMLYPASGNARNASASAKRRLNSMLQSRRALKSTTELSNALMSNIADDIADEIGQYMSQQ